jgi:serine/threonine protein kinase
MFYFNLFLALISISIQIQYAQTTSSHCFVDYSTIQYTVLSTSLADSYGKPLEDLGSGSSGSVSLIQRYHDSALVAVKRFAPPPSTASASRVTELEDYIKLEYYLGTLLNGHEGIVQTLDLLYEKPTGSWLLVTAYHAPSPLPDLNTTSALETFYKVLSAVAHIHATGVAHGDLKMENLIYITNGGPKLIDLGAATLLSCEVDLPDAHTLSNVIPGDAGTPAYLPPEVWDVLSYDREKADVWALGVLAVVLVAGGTPW